MKSNCQVMLQQVPPFSFKGLVQDASYSQILAFLRTRQKKRQSEIFKHPLIYIVILQIQLLESQGSMQAILVGSLWGLV